MQQKTDLRRKLENNDNNSASSLKSTRILSAVSITATLSLPNQNLHHPPEIVGDSRKDYIKPV